MKRFISATATIIAGLLFVLPYIHTIGFRWFSIVAVFALIAILTKEETR
ncbi:hypothetical protein M3616_13045 [Bacillus velezensis]|nr:MULTISPECIES: hypothetical protein [Bacillus amyloliquefaciens group]MCM3276300.1 hypothetical protein [Bacillus velezensis]MCM3350150.1 hypothetical protein [Bacillus velezensis]MCV4329248.1 hypothetical protein [Bacillus velezensis]MCY7682047.1 hypothetical protein [Bacillus velezensis]MEC1898447.1 hypothetical protein [Bacillus velezensis]